MNEILKSKIRIKLAENIEALFEDEDLTNGLQPFFFSDNYAEKMADAAINVLDAQKDLYDFLLEEGEIKE